MKLKLNIEDMTEGFFEDALQARRTLESLLLYEIAPSDTSRALAHNMLESLARTPPLRR